MKALFIILDNLSPWPPTDLLPGYDKVPQGAVLDDENRPLVVLDNVGSEDSHAWETSPSMFYGIKLSEILNKCGSYCAGTCDFFFKKLFDSLSETD